eukprot:763912-Hanusia_phi.AAC.1
MVDVVREFAAAIQWLHAAIDEAIMPRDVEQASLKGKDRGTGTGTGRDMQTLEEALATVEKLAIGQMEQAGGNTECDESGSNVEEEEMMEECESETGGMRERRLSNEEFEVATSNKIFTIVEDGIEMYPVGQAERGYSHVQIQAGLEEEKK